MKIIQKFKNKISPYSPRSLPKNINEISKSPAETPQINTCFICIEQCDRKYSDKNCNCNVYCHKKCSKEYNKKGSFACPICRTELIDKRINKYLVKLKRIFTRRSRRVNTIGTNLDNDEMEQIFERIREIMRTNEQINDDDGGFDREAFKALLVRIGVIGCFILLLAL